MKMKMITATLAGLFMSGSAIASTEVGAILGFGIMSAKSSAEGTGGSANGLLFGLRGGKRLDSGLAIDGQFLRHSGSSTVNVMGTEISTTTSQMLIGAGVRYYIGDGGVTPFVSSHLNYHLGASVGGSGASISVPESSGLGLDVGGGAQFGLGDTLYAEALGYYSLQLTGTNKLNNLGIGAGFGAKF